MKLLTERLWVNPQSFSCEADGFSAEYGILNLAYELSYLGECASATDGVDTASPLGSSPDAVLEDRGGTGEKPQKLFAGVFEKPVGRILRKAQDPEVQL